MGYEGLKIEPFVVFFVRKEDNYLIFADLKNRNKSVFYGYDTQNPLTFKNGEFEIEILEAAQNTTCSGKHAFWTVLINGQYKIGINSELLCDFIRKNEIINGKCTKKVWIGKKGAAYGLFTDNMSELEQAKKDAEARKNASKRTSEYPVGAIIGAAKPLWQYCGEYELHAKVVYKERISEVERIVILKKPIKRHIYKYVGAPKWHYYTFGSIFCYDISYFKDNYSTKIKSGHLFETPEYDFLQDYCEYCEKEIKQCKKNAKDGNDWYVFRALEHAVDCANMFKPDEIPELVKLYNDTPLGKLKPIELVYEK